MAWLSPPAERGNSRRFFRQSVELPIVVNVRNLPAPVYGTLLDISGSGCRFRSLVLVEKDRVVEFEWKRPTRPGIRLRGRIVMRRTPARGGAYEYGVAFDALPKTTIDELEKDIFELQRRTAVARTEERDEKEQAVAQSRVQRRRTFRALAAFAISYRRESALWTPAFANDIGPGGLRLACTELLPIGIELDLKFTLPKDVLDVYPPAGDKVEITPFGPRKVKIPDMRRAFEEMTLRGRVVSSFPPSRGRDVYGMQFLEVDGFTREEIARFTHAAQLARLRTTDDDRKP